MGIKDWFRGLLGRPARRDNYAGTYGNGNNLAFAGASVGRLAASLASFSSSVNADLDGSLTLMRARARQLAQSSSHGRRFLSLVATNVVGPVGPKLQVRAYMAQQRPGQAPVLDKVANDAIEVHYMRWSKRADIAGRMTLAQLYRLTAKAVARDGEALVRIVRGSSLPYGMALQLLEIDRLDETYNTTLPGGSYVRQGVELDSTGRPLAYYITTVHPGDRYRAARKEVERVPADQVRHIFLPERAEQVRGYTWLHAVILESSQLQEFKTAAVVAARIGASKVAALERTEESQPNGAELMADDGTPGGNLHMNVEAGEMFELPPGYKLSSWNPEYPHANFDSFLKAAMRGIAAGLDVAAHNLTGDMTEVNYSSARIAELGEREQWKVLQEWFHHTLVEPIYQDWLDSALIRGAITFPESGKSLPADKAQKFKDASKFLGRRWSWVDPEKDLKAAGLAVDLHVSSITRLAAEQGVDIEDIIDEQAQEQAMLEAAGLKKQPVAPAAEPEDDEEDEAEEEMRALRARLDVLERGHKIEVHNHVAPAAVSVPVEVRNEVQPGEATVHNHVTVPERSVNLEAVINTPAPVSETTTIERDAAHEAVRTTKQYTYKEHPNA
jgi:lambda family phage portal protein